MTKAQMAKAKEYLVHDENAVCIKPTDFELHIIQNRIILNHYSDLLIKEVRKRGECSHLTDNEIFITTNWGKLLRGHPLGIQFDISVYKLPDGCQVEFDTVSGYWGTSDDEDDWILRLSQMFDS